jgi:single-stranded-DNA-specific exonuclease
MPDALPRALSALLESRGFTDPAALRLRLSWESQDLMDQILSPAAIKGFDRAVEILLSAREKRETVVIHGDYDVDGMTGTALLWLSLRRAGLNCGWTLPRRDGEGYGLSDASLDRCQRGEGVNGLPEGADSRATWVVSVDTGVTAGPQITRAKAKGLGVIVTDHHLPGEGFPTEAAVLLDPYQEGCLYPNKGLCGAGLAWKLGKALLEATGAAAESDPLRLLQLVALGTLADMVPLTAENIALVRLGLRELHQRPLPGIEELLLNAKIKADKVPHGQELVFRVTPRLNSAGRMRQGELAIRLLLSANAEEARRSMDELESLNQKRQQLDQRITAEAMLQAQAQCGPTGEPPQAFVLSGDTWHEGVSGIVAQRIAERFGRPVFVLAPDPGQPLEWRGSGRSVPGTDLHIALSRCAHLLEKWGGHAQAAGLSLRRDKAELFRAEFLHAIEDARAGAKGPGPTGECRADLAEMDAELLGWLERLEPWGPTNPAPLFWTDSVQIVSLATVGEGKHMRLSLRQGGHQVDGIGFGLGGEASRLSLGQSVRVAYQPEWNEFRGRRQVQLRIKEIT